MTDKNFIRNLCMAAGLFIAFLLLAPIKFGPVTPDSAPVTAAVENTTATLDTTESVPTPEAPATETAPVYLDIPLTIGDSQYRFSVNRNKENVRELAIQVCNDNAAALGFTTADELEAQCVEPVVKSLKEQVDLTLEQVVAVELNIEGRNVQFEIDTAIATSIDDQAGVFCSNYGAEFGVTQETLADCTQNIKRALQERLTTPSQQQEEQLPAAQVFQTDLDIQGRVVRFNVEATYESIGEQARTFCTTHGTEFGVTEETLGECQQNIQRALEEKIVAFLQAQQEQQPPAATNPTFQTDLDIQGRVVRFNVEATYESIGEQATTFCTTHGAEFGVTEETLGECQQNIQRALEEKIVAFLSTE